MDLVTERRLGTLVGLAVGDALGAAVEFRPPGSFEPVTGYRGGGPHRLGPGEWTAAIKLGMCPDRPPPVSGSRSCGE